MKRILFLLAACLPAISGSAQTTISTATASGTWSLAGSPYLVQNIVSVNGGTSLTIEPGVEVRFSPGASLEVNGQLIAAGTASQRIVFHAADTTGWADDTQPAGGWHGLHIQAYSGSGEDATVLSYCDIADVKYGSASMGSGYFVTALLIWRNLHARYCRIYHNQSVAFNAPGEVINLYTNADAGTGDKIELDHCEIYNNAATYSTIRTGDFADGATWIHHSTLHHNTKGAGLWGVYSNLQFEDNEVYENSSLIDMSAIRISGMHVAIRRNHIHNNISTSNAAVTCWFGQVDIDNNRITNNSHIDGFCGSGQGGGGIHVLHNDGSSPDSTRYRIRNNVIANNTSPYGGGGVKVYACKALIANNHIVRNQGGMGNGIMMLVGADVDCRNNIFYGNGNLILNGAGSYFTGDVFNLAGTSVLRFDYNWTGQPLTDALYPDGSAGITGDASHNVVGALPGLTQCTADCGYMANALNTDFSLIASSSCIDNGDASANCQMTATDYAGNARMSGTGIDRGAYEYGSHSQAVGAVKAGMANLSVFPNPAGDQVSIQLPTAAGSLRIVDISGRTMLNKAVDNHLMSLRTASLQAGVYLVQWQDSSAQAQARLLVR